MISLSDQMLDSGCARHVEAVHGETIRILNGPDAGKVFTAVREIEPDVILMAQTNDDRRAKRIIRFRNSGPVPRIGKTDVLQTGDGKKWNAVVCPQNAYLTTDYELTEIVKGIDQQ